MILLAAALLALAPSGRTEESGPVLARVVSVDRETGIVELAVGGDAQQPGRLQKINAGEYALGGDVTPGEWVRVWPGGLSGQQATLRAVRPKALSGRAFERDGTGVRARLSRGSGGRRHAGGR